MKSLADFKRDFCEGREVILVERFGKPMGDKRVIEKVQSNSIMFRLDNDKTSWLDYPKATLLEYDGKTAKIYRAGKRGFTEEEKRILENEPDDEEQQRIDLLSDGSVMFRRRKRYYRDLGKDYLFGHKMEGKRRSGDKVIDDRVKGELDLVYELIG